MDPSRQDHRSTDPPPLRQRPNSPHTIYEAVPPATSHLNEKTGVYDHSSELESQSESQDATIGSMKDEPQTSVEEIEDTDEGESPERLSQIIPRVRLWVWWLAGALLIAIPSSMFATVFSTVNISGVEVKGLIIWLEVIWVAGWLIHLSLWFIGRGWARFCRPGLEAWEGYFLNTAMSPALLCPIACCLEQLLDHLSVQP
jgi:hypothetical protein